MVETPNRNERYVMNSGSGGISAGWIIAGAVLAIAIIAGIIWFNTGPTQPVTGVETQTPPPAMETTPMEPAPPIVEELPVTPAPEAAPETPVTPPATPAPAGQ